MSDRPLRIAHVVASAWPARGGVESLLQLCATAQAVDHQVGITAAAVKGGVSLGRESERASFEAFVIDGVRTAQFRLGRTSRVLPTLGALDRARGAGRVTNGRLRPRIVDLYGRRYGADLSRGLDAPDVIHSWSTGLLGTAAHRAAERLGVPYVLTPFCHPGSWGDDEASRALHRRADAVVALLESDARVLAGHGVPEPRLRVVGSCVPAPPPPGRSMRDLHEIRGDILVFLGVRRDYKGWDVALEAAHLVARNRPDVTVVFLGPGADVIPPPGDLRVIDAGAVDDQDKADWLRAADVLLLPSAHEIFPLSVLEAWSHGVPAVTSDLEPLRELSTRGGGSLVMERTAAAVAEGAERLLGDRALAVQTGDQGRAFWNAEGRPDAVGERLVEVYRELVRS